jgi:hypothetical protein
MSTPDAADPVKSPECAARIKDIVRAWGPLSDEQRAVIRAAFAPAVQALAARRKPPKEAA